MTKNDAMTFSQATIVQHCAVLGRLVDPVRAYRIGVVERYAQHSVSVCVAFIKPRKRRAWAVHIVPDNIRYLTIEVGDQVIYDSRVDVPCDMTRWAETDREFAERSARRKAAYVPHAGVTTSFREDNQVFQQRND